MLRMFDPSVTGGETVVFFPRPVATSTTSSLNSSRICFDALIVGKLIEERGERVLSSNAFSGLFGTPSQAVQRLFPEGPHADSATICLHGAGPNRRRDRTIVFRDRGVGMTAEDVPRFLFRMGSSRKDGVLWLMGAFGRGGLTVLPNAHGLVVLSRTSLDPDADVVFSLTRWEQVGNRQTDTALYQVTMPWGNDGDHALPLVLPAAVCKGFQHGTRIAVVGFRTEGIWVSRLGDERSLDTVIDTRLFESLLPVQLTAPVLKDRGSRVTRLRGLAHRLAANPRDDRLEVTERLPFHFEGKTYQLPIRFYLFPIGDVGSRRRFVAHDHALILNSNGQVHAHWTPAEFRHRTRLNKLADRILIVVDTDPLPLKLRTSLFTADRTELLRNPHAVRLEEEITAFLNEWDELWDANSEMIKDSIRQSNRDRSTTALSERIARLAEVRLRGVRRIPDSSRVRKRRPKSPSLLLDDPTEFRGPKSVTFARGRTHGLYFSLNARDGFVPNRTKCSVIIDHLDIDPEEDISVSDVRNGRIRVSVAVPHDAELTTAVLTANIDGWLAPHGGLRGALTTTTVVEVVDEHVPHPPQPAPPERSRAVTRQTPIATIWTTHEREDGWEASTPGDVEAVDARTLVDTISDGHRFTNIEDDVVLIRLNEEFAPLKAYASMRATTVGDEGVARAKERYALGFGVYLVLDHDRRRREIEPAIPQGSPLAMAIHAAAARGVLAILPDFDSLTAEAGLDGV